MRVLFIGNSHTYYNDMPQMFAEICCTEHREVEVTMLAHGGKGWDFHVEEPEVRFNILYGGYDAVVLQHMAHPMGDPEVMDKCGRKLIEWVKEAGARPILYMTWTTKEDGEAAQEIMSSAYRKLQEETGCELAPVGERWWKYHREHPEEEMYAQDGRHASEIGSRLAAGVIAEVFLGKINDRLKQIRESEKKSHIEIYSNEQLYKTESWLKKPIKIIQDIIPLFRGYKELKVLDLGCGVGRNCICIACEYKNINCTIECVDILELAIKKLYTNAAEYGVASNIHGIVKPIEDYVIKKNKYDLIIAVSALEHIDAENSFVNKLIEARDGICENGVVCLVINSNVREYDKVTGKQIPAQFEVNLSTKTIQSILTKTFVGWTVMKSTVQEQQYDIPRESGLSSLKTSVISFVARKVVK